MDGSVDVCTSTLTCNTGFYRPETFDHSLSVTADGSQCFDTVPVYDVNKSLFYGHETCDFSTASLNQLDLSLIGDYAFLYDLIYRFGKPNYVGLKVPILTNWNIQLRFIS